ncbi:MAG: hypothetical protein ABIQ57_07555 [Candidatus Kapaibacterium sp.]
MMFAASPYAFSQTQLIAHRSHGGDNESFRGAREDDFGNSPEMDYRMSRRGLSIGVIDTVIRLSDTSAIEIGRGRMGIETGRRLTDTVYRDHYWNNPHVTTDSLRRLFPAITFIGFEKKKTKKHADNGVDSDRGSTVAEGNKPSGEGERRGLMLMALCGAIVVPALAYGLRRS